MQKEQISTSQPDVSLEGITWSRTSSGMMMNSNSHTTLSLFRNEDHALFTLDEKPAFADTTISTRTLDGQVLSELSEIIRQDNLLELCDLHYVQETMMTDVSFGETISLNLRMPVSGSYRTVHQSIDCRAVSQRGKEERLQRLLARLQACRIEGTALETRVVKGQTGLGMGMFAAMMMGGAAVDANPLAPPAPHQPADPPTGASGKWTCPNCGYQKNQGRFCCECGAPHA